jgi:hypothetical protein
VRLAALAFLAGVGAAQAQSSFPVPSFTLEPDTCGGVNPLAPYYIIPSNSAYDIPLPIVLPVGDLLTVVSSLPANLQALAIVAGDGVTPLIELDPQVASYTNLTCPPTETVSVTDAQGYLTMVMVVDIVTSQ